MIRRCNGKQFAENVAVRLEKLFIVCNGIHNNNITNRNACIFYKADIITEAATASTSWFSEI